jgi:putative ABC transport system ATP-binding protein
VTSPPAAIEARNLTLTLGSGGRAVDILKGIDLDVPHGQTLALLGPSGSGKSSLMAVLAGLERASSGALQVAGQDFSALDEDDLARARRGRIGIVLQAFHLLPTMTALENVATPLELAGKEGPEDRAREELAAVGLGHRLDHFPAQLSGGEQQRVAIARALAPRQPLLFARRAEAGATLVMITHDEALAQRCERVVTLADGRIASDRAAP